MISNHPCSSTEKQTITSIFEAVSANVGFLATLLCQTCEPQCLIWEQKHLSAPGDGFSRFYLMPRLSRFAVCLILDLRTVKFYHLETDL